MSEQTQVIADVVADEVFGFNPFDPVFRADPYPSYARLREEEPFHQSPFGVLVLSRYADCLFMLQHPTVSSDERNSIAYKLFTVGCCSMNKQSAYRLSTKTPNGL